MLWGSEKFLVCDLNILLLFLVQIVSWNVREKDLVILSGHVVLYQIKLAYFKEIFPEYKDSETNKQTSKKTCRSGFKIIKNHKLNAEWILS